MPRNMSFAMTPEQVRNQTKDVTRRTGWSFLKVGDRVQPVEKAMGLKPGEKIKKIGGLIEITNIRQEPLKEITRSDVIREGFPGWTPSMFVSFLVGHYACSPEVVVNRIEFKYL